MSIKEKEYARSSSKGCLEKIVLEQLGLKEAVSIDNLVPKIFALASANFHHKRQGKYYIKNILVQNLTDKGLIKKVKIDKGYQVLKITQAGKDKLRQYALRKLSIKKPRRWDGKYRVIIFDIKEYKRSTRDNVRKWLEHLGFVRLQNSVWVYPYECQEICILLKSGFRLGKELLYMTVDSIENDRGLREKFKLR